MKTLRIIFAATLLAVPTLRAQVVNDGATNTLSNVTNTFTGDVTVGTNGSFTLLVLSDNVLLTNSVNGIIGRNATAKSNEVQLVSPSARWRMGNSLFVGSNGAMSRLVISNGAFVDSPSLSIVAQTAASSNNSVLVTGNGSVWSNAVLIIGSLGPGNRVLIEAGGLVYSDYGTVGSLGAGTNNEVIVTGPSSLWTNRFDLQIGGQRPFNRLIVSNGAAVRSDTGSVGNRGSNHVVVTGAGSVWSNQTALYIGFSNRVEVSDGGRLAGNHGSVSGPGTTVVLRDSGSGWNNLASFIVGENGSSALLIASNGATVLSSNAIIGSFSSAANGNLAILTGTGTLWSNRNDFIVGEFGAGNGLVVSNGAAVLSGNLIIGANSASAANRVTVDGGTLRVTNALVTGTLDVRRGTNVLNAGSVETDALRSTNILGRFEFNGGTLSTRSTIVNNGQSFRVGNGVSPATMILAGNGAHSFANGLNIQANAALTGNGSIVGNTLVFLGGTLSPGASIGTMAFSNPLLSSGVIIMEISKSGTVLTNDRIFVSGTITHNGLLTVTNIGPTALAAGDRFVLFVGSSYAGTFTSITLPPLPFGLRWSDNLLVDGSVEVVIATPPTVQTLPASSVTSVAATLNGVANPNGLDSVAWFEWGTNGNYANATPPRTVGSGGAETNFSEVITGLTGGVGYFFRAVASNSMGKVHGRSRGFAVGFALGTFCFDFNNGQLPANSVLRGNASISTTNGVGNSGVLKLTLALAGQMGSLIMEPLNPGATVTAMEARFDLRIGNDFTPHADGMSFVWSTGLPDVAFGEEYGGVLTGLPPLAGLAVSFDTINFGNEPGDPAPGVDVLWGSGIVDRFDLATFHPSLPSDFLITDENFGSVVITVSADGYLNVVYRNKPLVSNYHLSNFAGLTNARFAWGACTGGFWDNHFVDNICLTTFTDCPVPQILITRSGVNAAITFTGNLQSAPTVSGPWTDLQGAVSPHIIPTTGQNFFRAVSTCSNAP